jgi:hypothetical protein
MMKAQLITMATLVACLGISCSLEPRLKLCNHTEADITISVEGLKNQTTIAKGATAVFTFPFQQKHLVITTASSESRYDFPYPPRQYCEPVAASVIHAQLEPDGKLYVFLPDTHLPAADLSAQPTGFPLTPISVQPPQPQPSPSPIR